MVAQVISPYSALYEWENLFNAWRKASSGKGSSRAASGFAFKLEDNLWQLHDELADESYQPGTYTHFVIHEPKRRLISAAPFRDRIVHHALCNIIEPPFERSFIQHSYANRIRKGTHRALDTAQHWMKQYRYVLPCDIKQFFPSIDHPILYQTLSRQIQDGKIRRLITRILASGIGVLANEYDLVYFPDDDLFAANRARGLPIGNLTSQFWANCYLNPFDHFVTRQLGCMAYLRYVDDFLLFANEKAILWQWRAAIIERLAGLRLTLHEEQALVRPTSEGVRFLGFTIFPSHRRLLARKGFYFRRKLQQMLLDYRQQKRGRERIDRALRGWINHVRYGDTWGLRRALLQAVRL